MDGPSLRRHEESNVVSKVRKQIRQLIAKTGFEQDGLLIICGASVGTITAFGAIGFAKALEAGHEYAITQQGSGRIWLLLVLPMVGALLAGILVHYFAAEAKGHGVPQVMRALIKGGGRIPMRVGLVKIAASIFTVGTGGSAGTEGPIIQIGATAGSVFGRRLKLSREHLGTLIGCGAAAGIASIFNAPIAGVLFAIEILLRDFSLKTFMPIVIASVLSAAVTQSVLGENTAIFAAGELLQGYDFRLAEIPSYLVLGIACGLVAVGFNKLLHFGEDIYEKVPLHPLFKPVSGAALLGLLGITYVLIVRAASSDGSLHPIPPFFGNGYETILELLNPEFYTGAEAGGSIIPHALVVVALLVVLKAVATTFTLASGGSGGVFAPSLFMGATAGAAFGMILEKINLLPEGSSPAAYALVGMAAVVAGTTHGPLTAILILFELTRDVYVLLPIMLAAVVATSVARIVERDSIYTYKLRRAGLAVGSARDLTVMRRIPVSSVEQTPLPSEPIYPTDPLSKLVQLRVYHNVPDFVVVDQQGTYMGLVSGADMRTALIDREAIPLLLVAELLRTDLPTIDPDEHLDTVMDKFASHDVASLPIMDRPGGDKPAALITRVRLLHRYQQVLEES